MELFSKYLIVLFIIHNCRPLGEYSTHPNENMYSFYHMWLRRDSIYRYYLTGLQAIFDTHMQTVLHIMRSQELTLLTKAGRRVKFGV